MYVCVCALSFGRKLVWRVDMYVLCDMGVGRCLVCLSVSLLLAHSSHLHTPSFACWCAVLCCRVPLYLVKYFECPPQGSQCARSSWFVVPPTMNPPSINKSNVSLECPSVHDSSFVVALLVCGEVCLIASSLARWLACCFFLVSPVCKGSLASMHGFLCALV